VSALRAAWLLAQKDLRLFVRDRIGLLLGLVLPIVLLIVFGYVMQIAFGGGGKLPKVTLWVADEDRTDASRRLVEELRRTGMLSVQPRADAPATAPAELRRKITDGDAHHALWIGAGYGEALAAGQLPPLTILRDPGRSMEASLIDIGVMQAVMTATDGRIWPALLGRTMARQGMSAAGVERIVAGTAAVQNLIEAFAGGADPALRDGAAAPAPDLDAGSFLTAMSPVVHEDIRPPARPKQLTWSIAQAVSGVAVMMLMFGLMAASNTLLDERAGGTLRRLFAAPIPRESVLLGKFLLCAIVGLGQLAVMFVVAELVFGVGTFRDPWTLLVLAITWAACATSFGIVIAAWAKTTKQAEGLATLLILVMAALGGCWFPIQIADLPLAAEIVTRSTLTYWAMTGFQGMYWHHWTLANPQMLTAVGVQWGIAIAGALLARHLFRRRLA
jgi:ABC-2 type transport system permease protein